MSAGGAPAPVLPPVVPPPPAASHAGAVARGLARLAPPGRVWQLVTAAILLPPVQIAGHLFVVWRLTPRHGAGGPGHGARRLARLLSPLGAALPVAAIPLWFGVVGSLGGPTWARVDAQVGAAVLAGAAALASLVPLRRHLRGVLRGAERAAALAPLHRAMAALAVQALAPAALFAVLRAEAISTMAARVSPTVAVPSALLAAVAGLACWLYVVRLAGVVGRLPVPEPRGTTPRLTRWRAALQGAHGLTVSPTDGGFSTEGRIGGLPCTLWVDLSRHPAAGELVVHLPGLAATHPRLVIRARGPGEPAGVALRDPILSRLVWVRGVPGETADRLVADLHDLLLDVVQGLPGASLTAGRLTAPLGLWPADPAAGVDLDDALARVVGLAAALEARAAPGPGGQPVNGAASPR